MFRIRYLRANDAWCVTDGHNILTLDAYERGKRLFSTREELVDALRTIGLLVDRQGHVFSRGI